MQIAVDQALVTEAYLYGFPLVFNLDQVQRYVREGVGANPAAPFNTFSHARALAGPEDTFVTINNDTVYSMAQLDLSVGPVALHVPDTAGRYYVLQFVDVWTNNFAYVGHRATGTAERDFYLVPPGWDGDVPTGHTLIRFPTMVASIVGRWAVASDADLPVVHALQDATTLTPADASATPVGIAKPDGAVPDDVAFLEKLRVWSQQFPPAPGGTNRCRQVSRRWAPPLTGRRRTPACRRNPRRPRGRADSRAGDAASGAGVRSQS